MPRSQNTMLHRMLRYLAAPWKEAAKVIYRSFYPPLFPGELKVGEPLNG